MEVLADAEAPKALADAEAAGIELGELRVAAQARLLSVGCYPFVRLLVCRPPRQRLRLAPLRLRLPP
jgi:hypothetical protein